MADQTLEHNFAFLFSYISQIFSQMRCTIDRKRIDKLHHS